MGTIISKGYGNVVLLLLDTEIWRIQCWRQASFSLLEGMVYSSSERRAAI
jgi:hypothetical protein